MAYSREGGVAVSAAPLPHGQAAQDTNWEEPEGAAETGYAELVIEYANLTQH